MSIFFNNDFWRAASDSIYPGKLNRKWVIDIYGLFTAPLGLIRTVVH